MNYLTLIFLFLCGHSLADAVMQTNTMALGKRRNKSIDMNKVPVGQKPMNLWYMWLTHHALIHGLIVWSIVYLFTKNYIIATTLGIFETVAHWIIDFLKSEGLFNPITDQLLHLGTKSIYIIYLMT